MCVFTKTVLLEVLVVLIGIYVHFRLNRLPHISISADHEMTFLLII